jgi:hypothetical protein
VSVIILPNKFRKQPQYAAPIDNAGLGKDLQILFNPALGPIDLVTGRVWTPGGDAKIITGNQGRSFNFDGVDDYYAYTGYPELTSNVGTFFIWCTRVGVADTNGHVLFGASSPNVSGHQVYPDLTVSVGSNARSGTSLTSWFNTTNRSLVIVSGGTAATTKVYLDGVDSGITWSTAPVAWGSGNKNFNLGRYVGGTSWDTDASVLSVGMTSQVWKEQEAKEFHRNPWSLYKAPKRKLYVVSTSSTLTSTNNSQANSSSTAAITSDNALSVSNSTEINASQINSISQDQTLVGVNSTQENNSSTVVIEVKSDLTVSNSDNSNSSQAVGITQDQTLVGDNVSQENSSPSVVADISTGAKNGIYIPRKNKKQPQYLTPLDKRHPLIKEIAFAYSAGRGLEDGAHGFPGSITGTMVSGITEKGRYVMPSDATSVISFADNPDYNITSGVTAIALIRVNSNATALQNIVGKANNNGANDSPFIFSLDSGNVIFGRSGSSAGGPNYRVWGSAATISANTYYVLAASQVSEISTPAKFYINGKLDTGAPSNFYGGSGSGLATTNTRPVKIGNRDDGTYQCLSNIYDVIVFKRVLTDAEIWEVSQDIHSIWQKPAIRRNFATSVIPSSNDLVGEDSSETNSSDNGIVTQDQILTGINSTQIDSSNTGSVTQGQIFTGDNASQENSSLIDDITQDQILIDLSVTQTNSSNYIAVTQDQNIISLSSTQVNSESSSNVTQEHGLVSSSVTQTNVSSNPDISGSSLDISGVNSTQTNSALENSVSQTQELVSSTNTEVNSSSVNSVSQDQTLVELNVTQTDLSSVGSLTQEQNLSSDSVVEINLSGSQTLTQSHSLSGSSNSQENPASISTLSQSHELSGISSTQSSVSSTNSVGVNTIVVNLSGSSNSQDNSSSVTLISQQHNISLLSCVEGNSVSSAVVTGNHILLSTNNTELHSSSVVSITEDQILAINNVTQESSSNVASVTQTQNLIILNNIQGSLSSSVSISQDVIHNLVSLNVVQGNLALTSSNISQLHDLILLDSTQNNFSPYRIISLKPLEINQKYISYARRRNYSSMAKSRDYYSVSNARDYSGRS